MTMPIRCEDYWSRERINANSVKCVACFCFGLVVLAVAECNAADESGSDDLWKQLREKGPSGWMALADSASHLDGVAHYRRANRVTETRFKINGSSILFDISKIGPDGQRANTSVGARNPDYSFSLSKSPEQSEWTLDELGPTQPSNPYLRAKRTGFLRFVEMPWTLLDMPLSDVLKAESFRPIKARNLDYASIVEFTFSITFPFEYGDRATRETIRGDFIADTVVIHIDTSRSWALQYYRAHGRFDGVADMSGTLEAELEYQQIGRVAPLIKRVISRRIADDASEDSESIFEVSEVEVRDVPESEFKLAAYGMSEETRGGNF